MFRNIRLIITSLLCIITINAYGVPQSYANKGKNANLPQSNGIAAKVGKDIITMDDVRREVGPLVAQIQRESKDEEIFKVRVERAGHDALEKLIDKKVIVQEFRATRKAPPSIFENNYNDTIRNQFNGDKDRLHNYLNARGMTERDYKKEVEEDLIVHFMRAELRNSQAEISPEKIKTYYEEHKNNYKQQESLHLKLIKLSPLTNESTDLLIQEANQILADVKAGKDFSEIAKEKSQDESKVRGGDWGWIKRGEIRSELDEVAFSLKPGNYSKPITVGESVYIINIADKMEEGFIPLDKVRKEIETILVGKANQESYMNWIKKLRKKVYIKYYY